MDKIKLTPIVDSIEFIEMSDEEYFSDKYSDWISNSKLSLINPEQGGSPEMYMEGLSKHPKYSDSLVFGSAVHCLLLQPDSFEVADGIDRPTAKMGAMADELYKIYKKDKMPTYEDIIKASDKIDYYKGKMNEDKIKNVLSKCQKYWDDRKLWESNPMDKEPIYLDMKSREKLAQCLTQLENNREIQSLLHPLGILEEPVSMNEAALFMDIKASSGGKETILKIKAKLDNFTIDLENNEIVLNDLKTTGHYLSQFGESFDKYHYNRQMASYLWLLTLYAKKYYNISNINSLKANMLLISTVPDYNSGVFKVTKNEIEKGFCEFSNLLKRVAKLTL